MFSMFFGAGNVVFPLSLGQYAQDQQIPAIIGLLITAVGVPFLGLLAMILFNGSYHTFFERMGKVPGFIVMIIIMILLGPLGALPRCIALAYSTTSVYLPNLPLPVYSIVACFFIFLFTFRLNAVIDLLGAVLTPFLLISLGSIITIALWNYSEVPVNTDSSFTVFFKGLEQGYQTMDLLGAFFFSTVVLLSLKSHQEGNEKTDHRALLSATIQASVIGASLLGLSYIGFVYTASSMSTTLAEFPPEQLIGAIAESVLGPYGGVAVCVAVTLACFTTAIALAAVFAEFLADEIAPNKISYPMALVATLVVAAGVAMLNFNGIVALLGPILQVCYPALIVLTICNILYKLFNFPYVKVPVGIVFLISLIYTLFV